MRAIIEFANLAFDDFRSLEKETKVLHVYKKTIDSLFLERNSRIELFANEHIGRHVSIVPSFPRRYDNVGTCFFSGIKLFLGSFLDTQHTLGIPISTYSLLIVPSIWIKRGL